MSEVLDRNLRELLRRHRAVAADPLFRERLGARFVAAALDAARPAAPVTRRAPEIPVLRRAALLAAAGLLALFGAWWLAEGGAAPRSRLDELLAQSGAAAREQRDGDWHAAGDARLALSADYLEAAHTGRAELAVDLPGLGEAALLAGTPARASFEREGDAVRVRVLSGRVALRRGGATTELTAGRSALLSPASTLALPGPDSAAPRPLAPTTGVAPPESPPQPGELRGRVVRAADGTPVADALLVLAVTDVTAQGPRIVTLRLHDADGRFRWTPPPGRFHFFVLADGFAAHITRNVQIDSALVLPDVRVELEPGVTVGGTVVDADSGAPIPDALVVSDSDWPSIGIPLTREDLQGDSPGDPELIRAHAVTGADGRFELPHLASGGQVLRASAAGHAPAWIVLPAGETADATLRLPRGGAVEGRVLRTDGEPWPKVLMVASFNSPEPLARTMSYGLSFTDGDGHYRIDDLPAQPGVVLLIDVAASPSAMPPMQALLITAGRTTTVDFGQPRAARGASLSGTVTQPDGTPAAGLMLGLSPIGGNPMTDWSGAMADDRGAYRFSDLPAASFEFFAAFGTNGTVTLLDQVELGGDETRQLDARLPGGGLSGRALAADGTPLVGANAIAWLGTGGDWTFAARAIADERGTWIVRALRPGSYRVIVYDAKGAAADVRLDGLQVADGVLAGLDTAQPPGGHLLVRVTHDGAPVAGAGVTLRDQQGDVWELGRPYNVTGADGTLRLDGVPAGRWDVAVESGGSNAAGRADVEAGAVAELAIVLPAGR